MGFEPLRILVEDAGQQLHVRLEGEFDLVGMELFRKQVEPLAEQARGRVLVLDLRGLTFMDSSGIRAILELDAESRRDGFELVVVNGSDGVARVIAADGPSRDRPAGERAAGQLTSTVSRAAATGRSPVVQRLLSIWIAGGSDAPQRARRALHALDEQLGGTYGDAALLVSELVTNAVTHARASVVGLCVSRSDSGVRVEVTATGPAFEPPERPDPDSPGGFGFLLVARVAENWGVARDDRENRVWFELPGAQRTVAS